jgi:putative ABC transport system substrate-binding protein
VKKKVTVLILSARLFALSPMHFALCLLGAMLLALSFPVEAQPPKKVPRIGFLATSSVERNKTRLAGFQQGLRELGYLEGKSIFIEQRYAAAQYEKLPEFAAELIRLNVDVLVTEGAPAAHAAKNATGIIPIVMGNASDPVGTGLVASLARPGGNVTGLSDFNIGVVRKRLELVKDVIPSASRVAVLLNPANPTNPLQLQELQAAAPALGLTLLSLEAKRPEDIDLAFTAIRRESPSGLIQVGDSLFGTNQKRILEHLVAIRLPAIYSTRVGVDAGGLMSYGTNFDDLYRRAATYVDKLLKGTKPADLPVEQPTKFQLVINLKAARRINLTIPPAVLMWADEVIK